jgi:hypothetical protein
MLWTPFYLKCGRKLRPKLCNLTPFTNIIHNVMVSTSDIGQKSKTFSFFQVRALRGHTTNVGAVVFNPKATLDLDM